MKIFPLSLRNRLFFAMIILTLIASVLIGVVTIYQYSEEAKDYHRDRLERKEQAIKESVSYHLRNTSYAVNTKNLPLIFKEKIYEISDIHGLQINIYDLKGTLLKKSKGSFVKDTTDQSITAEFLDKIKKSDDKRFVSKSIVDGINYQSSYTYITDPKFKTIGIINLKYVGKDDFITRELNEFLKRLSVVYIFLLLIAILLAYLLSKYYTKSLEKIADKITETRLGERNKRIDIGENPSSELGVLVSSYNSMIDELEESAVKLATSEREQAWREMAKQVAHEIKNPLTPMRLTVQSFERRFDPEDPEIKDKIKEYSSSLIQQIDTMSNIAGAFSAFAKMPAQQSELLNVPKIVKLGLDIFNERYIRYSTTDEKIMAKLDRTQLIRIITNLVKNALQATENTEDPQIKVDIAKEDNSVTIQVADNGTGILPEHEEKVFEPKFTTKSSGMGLGLPMIKNIIETYGGSIAFNTTYGTGTTFTVRFPKAE